MPLEKAGVGGFVEDLAKGCNNDSSNVDDYAYHSIGNQTHVSDRP